MIKQPPIIQQLNKMKILYQNYQEIVNIQGRLQNKQSQIAKQELKKLIQKKQMYDEELTQKLENVMEKIMSGEISYFVFMYGTGYLQNLIGSIQMQKIFKNNPNLQSRNNFNNCQKLIFQHYEKLIPNFLETFWKNNSKYKFGKQDQKSNNKIQENSQKQQEIINKNKQFLNILNVLIETQKQSKKSNNSINYVYKSLLQFQNSHRNSEDKYQQSALNWIKYMLNQMRTQKQYICCRTFFGDRQVFQCPKKILFEFKDYTKQNSQKIIKWQQELAKSICGLMNQRGGVVFLGVTPQAGMHVVQGFDIEEKNKKQLLKIIMGAISQIMPKHKGFKQSAEITNSYFLLPFEINNYISVQFMNVINTTSYQNCRNPQKLHTKKFICKIFVKIGHPRYWYYLLKNQGNVNDKKQAQIHFYIKQQSNILKDTVQRRYEKIYEKLIQYQKLKKDKKVGFRPNIHDGCRYDMRLQFEKILLDSQQSD